jgi:hypothetical protein
VKYAAKGNYTDATWNAFQSALTSVQTIANIANATQTEIDNAIVALNTAFAGLTEKTPIVDPPIDPPAQKGIFGTNAKWTGEWWHYLLFFLGFGFIWM